MQNISVLIKPASSSCNMHCNYCFYDDVSSYRDDFCKGKMSLSTIEKIVKEVLTYAKYSATFMFQGGEPTLVGLDFYKHFIALIDKYNINKLNVQCALQTNAYALNDDWCQFFSTNNFLIGVSLDGTQDVFDKYRHKKNGQSAYSNVINGINLLKKYQVEFNILSVVTDHSLRTLKESFNFFLQNNLTFIQYIACIDDFENLDQSFDINFKEKVHHKSDDTLPKLSMENYGKFLVDSFDMWFECLMRGQYISIRHIDNYLSILMGRDAIACNMVGHCSIQYVIEADGSVYPCDFYARDDFYLGNIKTDNLYDIKMCQKAKDFLSVSYKKPKLCTNCDYYFICRNACRRDRVFVDEDNPNLNKYCSAYKHFFGQRLDKLKYALKILLANYQ